MPISIRPFYAIGVHRAALHGALWQAFVGSGAAIETGWTIVDVAAGADGRARLIGDDARTSPGFDLVVDASGARSSLRRLTTQAAARQFAYGAVWASVADRGIAPATLAQRYVGARIMIGHLPVGRIDARIAAARGFLLEPEAGRLSRLARGVRRLARRRSRFCGRRWRLSSPPLDGPDDLTLASYMHFTARRPFRGPLALIGDAAHATSPQLGQGANSALLDALALADALDATGDIAQALASYARLRRRHVRFYQLASAAMTPFFQSDSRVLADLRDLAFHRMKIIPWLRREMLLHARRPEDRSLHQRVGADARRIDGTRRKKRPLTRLFRWDELAP